MYSRESAGFKISYMLSACCFLIKCATAEHSLWGVPQKWCTCTTFSLWSTGVNSVSPSIWMAITIRRLQECNWRCEGSEGNQKAAGRKNSHFQCSSQFLNINLPGETEKKYPGDFFFSFGMEFLSPVTLFFLFGYMSIIHDFYLLPSLPFPFLT